MAAQTPAAKMTAFSVALYARESTDNGRDIIRFWRSIMHATGEFAGVELKDRIRASELLMERASGSPPKVFEIRQGASGNPQDITNEEWRTLNAAHKRLTGGDDGPSDH